MSILLNIKIIYLTRVNMYIYLSTYIQTCTYVSLAESWQDLLYGNYLYNNRQTGWGWSAMGKALFVLKHLIHSFLVVDDLAIHCYDIFLLFINLELCYGFVMSCVIVTLNLLLTGSNFPFLDIIHTYCLKGRPCDFEKVFTTTNVLEFVVGIHMYIYCIYCNLLSYSRKLGNFCMWLCNLFFPL